MARRALIATKGDKRHVRRRQCRFKESDDVGRPLAQDVRHRARNEAMSGQGDRGDQETC